MDATELIRLLNTDHYSPANLEEVNDLCRNYPMFNLGHMLKARIGAALEIPVDDAVRTAAVYAVDRSMLYRMVNEVKPGVKEEEAVGEQQNQEGIQFSEESTQEADVIIVQHAPYAAPEPDETLLELDEEETPEKEEQDLSSEDLVGVVVKDEADMEEPMPEESGIPSIDVVEPDEGEEEPTVGEVDSEKDGPSAEKEENSASEPESETAQNIAPEKGTTASEGKHLIEQFIRGEAGPIRADKEISLKGDVSVASVREHDGFITDTLAKIYVKQGLYAKAIYAYEKLSLKYPEKSAYFAAQIEKIKNITQS